MPQPISFLIIKNLRIEISHNKFITHVTQRTRHFLEIGQIQSTVYKCNVTSNNYMNKKTGIKMVHFAPKRIILLFGSITEGHKSAKVIIKENQLLQLTAVNNLHLFHRSILSSSFDLLDLLQHIEAFQHTRKHHMLTVEPWCLRVCDEELRTCNRNGIQNQSFSVLLIRETVRTHIPLLSGPELAMLTTPAPE